MPWLWTASCWRDWIPSNPPPLAHESSDFWPQSALDPPSPALSHQCTLSIAAVRVCTLHTCTSTDHVTELTAMTTLFNDQQEHRRRSRSSPSVVGENCRSRRTPSPAVSERESKIGVHDEHLSTNSNLPRVGNAAATTVATGIACVRESTGGNTLFACACSV